MQRTESARGESDFGPRLGMTGARIEPSERPSGITGGGTDGNERLTVITGTVLIVMLAVLGITILQIHQLIWLHLFVGLALLGPLAMKLASTGYRFTRYYTHDPAYVQKGPPQLFMRLLAPAVVGLTLIVFISGIVLLADGPQDRGSVLFIHKASFILWIGAAALHVLGHLPLVTRSLDPRTAPLVSGGAAGRRLAIAGAIVAGLVLAVVLIPDFAVWTSHGFGDHHH